jgi:hypothetical protein
MRNSKKYLCLLKPIAATAGLAVALSFSAASRLDAADPCGCSTYVASITNTWWSQMANGTWCYNQTGTAACATGVCGYTLMACNDGSQTISGISGCTCWGQEQ